MSTSTHIGFWASSSDDLESNYPWPQERPLPISKDTQHFLNCLDRVESTASYLTYKGLSWCRICECDNGCQEYESGQFVWPSGYSHYIREHNVEVPKDFVDYIVNLPQ